MVLDEPVHVDHLKQLLGIELAKYLDRVQWGYGAMRTNACIPTYERRDRLV